MQRLLTLCFVIQNNTILLGLKKRGFGSGKWNGFGGKVEPDETIAEAAKRELFEEAGITLTESHQQATILFSLPTLPDQLEVHVFRVTQFFGDPQETEEMQPQWFPLTDIPYATMWDDDKYWLPLFLQGKHFTAKFTFDEQDKVISSSITDE